MKVQTGDVAVLPVGTGHCRIESSPDFLVVGAYPEHATWDVCRSAPDAVARERMKAMGVPAKDPVAGITGKFWRS